jgi:hypothetical protein
VVNDCLRELLDIEAIVTDRVARYPSPSVLVNGVDVMGAPVDGRRRMSARLADAKRLAPTLRSVTVSA